MRVILTQPHTHAGKDYVPGDDLELSERTAHWLHSIQSADIVDASPEGAAEPEVDDHPSSHGDDHVVE